MKKKPHLYILVMLMLLCMSSATAWMALPAVWRASSVIAGISNILGFGLNANGQLGDTSTTNTSTPVLVSGNWGDWRMLDGGDAHTCGLRGGTAYCWGLNTNGRLGTGNTTQRTSPTLISGGGTTTWTDISAGQTHSCGIRNGSALCWGLNSSNQLGDTTTTQRTAPTAVNGGFTNWTAISAGDVHSCGIQSGMAYCWGSNSTWQIGDSGTQYPSRSSPSLVLGGWTNWTDINAGMTHTCGIRGGTAYCWGDNVTYGMLGDGTTTTRTSPTLVLGGWTDWTNISTGKIHSCGIRAGTAYCWGSNSGGLLGNGTLTWSVSPSLVSGGWTDWSSISASSEFTCGIRASKVYCWGQNYYGETGATPSVIDPLNYSPNTGTTSISGGTYGGCSVKSGVAYCWGYSANGQLGNNTITPNQYSPVVVSGGFTNWTKVSRGSFHTCGIRGGAAYCWGQNTYYNLGNNTTTQSNVPTLASGGWTDWTDIAGGGYHSCGIRAGTAYCWGEASSGQVGNNTSGTDITIPTSVNGGGTNWTAIATGDTHSCGIRGGAAYCWGNNASSRLGDTTTTQRNIPTLVAGGWTDWTKISAGNSQSCGIRSGTAYCWGSNGSGQVGDGGALTTRTSPTLVSGGWTDWTDISTRAGVSCGIRGGTAYCWGANDLGQLNNGTKTNATSPSLVLGGWTDWTAIAAGSGFACGTRSASNLAYCWGWLDTGRTGIGLAFAIPQLVSGITSTNVLTAVTTGSSFTLVVSGTNP